VQVAWIVVKEPCGERCSPRATSDASFGPEALRAIGQAFDAAWAEIAGNFGSDPQNIERARLRLARAMFSIANAGISTLKRAALEQMALDYRKSGGA